MAHLPRYNSPSSFQEAQEKIWGKVPGILTVEFVSGDQVRRALISRFGSSFHNPHMNGRFWRAARAALGCTAGDTGEIAPDHRGFWTNEESFVAGVERVLATPSP